MTQTIPGLDLPRFTEWLEARVGVRGPVRAELIAGGRSNLTYRIFDDTNRWVLRRPPLGHVLATAHDMAREYRVLEALAPTHVPVPRPIAFSDDLDVLGTPFYVMDHVDGESYRHKSQLESLGADRTRTIALRQVDALAALHEVDPAEVGLSDFGRAEGFLPRQVERWRKQLDASYSRDLPDAALLYEKLAASVPEPSRSGIVHGDFRLDNLLVDDNDEIRAIVDWEMATLGDPLTDLALLAMYQRLNDLISGTSFTDAPHAPGYPTEAELIAHYGAASDRELDNFGFYLGLAAFKAASILEGIHYRYQAGQTVGADFDTIGNAVPPLLAAGLDALAGRE